MNTKKLMFLREQLEHLEYYNRMAPFPVYDTEYVGKVKQTIKDMEVSKINYDELPVAACKYCTSLYVVADEIENDICMRCGAINEIVIYKDIADYQKRKDE